MLGPGKEIVVQVFVVFNIGERRRLYSPQHLILINGITGGRATQPEKAMAPHSSTLAWKIPWMEEPGGLQSMESRRVGHN